MTEEEKAEARATDPKAAAIIERCDRMTPEQLQRLHGVLRDPFGAGPDLFPGPDSFAVGLADDPYAIFDDDHDPETASVLIFGERIGKGSMVRINPQRRADAQDLFYADQLARVVAVHRDLDGETHLAVVLVDDPGGRAARLVRPLPLLRPGRVRTRGRHLDEHPHASPPTMEPRKETRNEHAGQDHHGPAGRRGSRSCGGSGAVASRHPSLPRDPLDVSRTSRWEE